MINYRSNQCSEALCRRIRRSIIEMTHMTGNIGAHLGGSLSMVEMLATLYSDVLRYDPSDTDWEERDRVILSKGHAALALYSPLAEVGIIDCEELKTFKMDGSRLGGHPSLNGLPGIEYASGSLGQGLSIGVGVCLALLQKNNVKSRVFVFLGDGECDEGSVWEAAGSASHYKLNQLTAVVDVNAIQYDGYTRDIMDLTPFEDKWRDFGWDVVTVDGHNIGQLTKAYTQPHNKPMAILARSIKGKGVSFMENNWRYHNASLTDDLYDKALAELEVM